MPFGSSVRLSVRIRSSATGSFTLGSRSRFITPMPCSAEIEPPYFCTTREHRVVHLVPARQEFRLVGADRLGDVVVDVAVAEMAERHRPRAGDQLSTTAAFASRDESRHRGDRHRDVVLDRAAVVLLRLAEVLADAPERLRLVEALGDGGVVDQTALDAARPGCPPACSRRPARACDDNSISTYQGCGSPSGSRQPARA